MGGESGRMFPLTLQTPTCHPHLYFSHTDECTYAHLLPSFLCGSQQLLSLRCKSGADMRGSVVKLVFGKKAHQTGQVARRSNTLSLKPRDKLHTRRTAPQSHHLSFHSVRREFGSKWEDARPSRERREIIRRYAAVTAKYYSLWYIDQRNLSYCSLRIKCGEQNCSFYHNEHLLWWRWQWKWELSLTSLHLHHVKKENVSSLTLFGLHVEFWMSI